MPRCLLLLAVALSSPVLAAPMPIDRDAVSGARSDYVPPLRDTAPHSALSPCA